MQSCKSPLRAAGEHICRAVRDPSPDLAVKFCSPLYDIVWSPVVSQSQFQGSCFMPNHLCSTCWLCISPTDCILQLVVLVASLESRPIAG